MLVTGRSVLSSLIILVTSVLPIAAQVYPDHVVDSLLSSGIHNLVKQDYTKANSDFEILDEEFPGFPAGKIFLAAASMSESFDLGLQFQSDYTDSLLTLALEQSLKLIEIEPGNKWSTYFAGLAYVFMGYNDALRNDVINALFNGYSSLQYFDDCLLFDKDFYEAKIPIGSYLYWKADKSLDLSWLPFFPDDKANGIALLKSAADSTNYLRYFADYSLMVIYYNEEDYDKAIELAETFLAKYPDSRLFQMGLAKSLRFIDKKKAIQVFELLLNSYRELTYNNHLKEIFLLKMIAELYLETGQYKKAVETCNMIPELNELTDFVKTASTERLQAIQEIKNKSVELMQDN